MCQEENSENILIIMKILCIHEYNILWVHVSKLIIVLSSSVCVFGGVFRSLSVGTKTGYRLFSVTGVDKLDCIHEGGNKRNTQLLLCGFKDRKYKHYRMAALSAQPVMQTVRTVWQTSFLHPKTTEWTKLCQRYTICSVIFDSCRKIRLYGPCPHNVNRPSD